MTTRLYSTKAKPNNSVLSLGQQPAVSPLSLYLSGATTSVPDASAIAQSTVGGALSGGVGSYDIDSDPAVAAAKGLSARIRAQAQATALAKRTEAAIEFGSAEGLQSALGDKYADVAKKAADNPFSIQKQQQFNYQQGLQGLEDSLNKANLFYSGYRGKQLGDASRAFQLNQYNAANSFRGLQSDITDQLNSALLNADEIDMNAMLASQGGSYGGGGGDGGYQGINLGMELPPGFSSAGIPNVGVPSPAQVRAGLGGGGYSSAYTIRRTPGGTRVVPTRPGFPGGRI